MQGSIWLQNKRNARQDLNLTTTLCIRVHNWSKPSLLSPRGFLQMRNDRRSRGLPLTTIGKLNVVSVWSHWSLNFYCSDSRDYVRVYNPVIKQFTFWPHFWNNKKEKQNKQTKNPKTCLLNYTWKHLNFIFLINWFYFRRLINKPG